MDEPFSGLDSRLRDAVREQSMDLLKETRSTAVVVTHDAEEALRVGDQIALIRDGKLVQIGSGRDLYYNPKSLFVAGFFSEINVVPYTYRGGTIQTVFGNIRGNVNGSGTGYAALRQTDVSVTPYTKTGTGLRGRITARRFLGTNELLDIVVEGMEKPLQARVRAGKVHRDKTAVLVKVDPKLMMIFPNADK